MKHAIINEPASTVSADAVAVGVYEDRSLTGPARNIDSATEGLLSRLLAAQEIAGKRFQVTPLWGPHGVAATQVLIVGLGSRDTLDAGTMYRAAATAANVLSSRPRQRVAMTLETGLPGSLRERCISGCIVGSEGQDLYRREKERFPFAEVGWPAEFANQLDDGRTVGEAINLARRLVNEPPSVMYPETFAAAAEQVAASARLDIEIWDEQKLERERCAALLAVGRGSLRPPRLVILRHRGGPPGPPALALVGKGVTFDSGGFSLKPSEGMITMKCDMAGAATVLGAMDVIGRRGLPLNVLAVMGLAENLPSHNAFKLGDVLTARNGITIEVHNTDAEGRLVLADALAVAVDQKAQRVIDLATLTGACMVALGTDIAGLMTNHQPWCDEVRSAAEACGEPVWQLPMVAEFDEQISSKVADIKNVGEGRWGGAITAAKLLERFVVGVPWVHMDVAGPAFLEKPKPWCDGGGTGAFVATLVEVAQGLAGRDTTMVPMQGR